MRGLIEVEVAVQILELADEARNQAPAAEGLDPNMIDIYEQHLKYMHEY